MVNQDFNVNQINNGPETELKSQKKNKHILIAIVGIIVILVIVVGFLFIRNWFTFSKNNVELEVDYPAEINSGENIEFTISYHNKNRIKLEDVQLTINYPSGVYLKNHQEINQQVVEIGEIPAQQKGSKKFNIRMVGEKGSIKRGEARLSYHPQGIGSVYQNQASFKMEIISVLVDVFLTVPEKAISGGKMHYILDYINNSDIDFSNLKIELEYPSDFVFQESTPEPDQENNIWEIDSLGQGERGNIKVTGILEGDQGETKKLNASIYQVEDKKELKYTQVSAVTKISSSPLLVNLFLNNKEEGGTIDAGQKLDYKIEFKNNSDIALSQLTLKAYLEGEMLNFKSLKLDQKGFFDSLNNVITWSASGASSLSLLPPGESGIISFSLEAYDNFVINSLDDKNFKIKVRTELETLNVPTQLNLDKLKVEKILTSKVNSKVSLNAKGYHRETTSDLGNSGPIPPEVNKPTTYTIHWQIINSSNDLEDIRVSAVLPEGIKWTNKHSSVGSGENLEFNSRINQIVWEIDKIYAGTGHLRPVRELVFQIELTPSLIQVGSRPILINESRLTAIDLFTEKSLKAFSSAIDTSLPDDPTIDFSDSKVVK